MPEKDAAVEQPEVEAPEENGQASPEPGEFFSDKFDPESLAPELRSQYDLMRSDYTKKTTEVAEQRKAADESARWQELLLDPSTRNQALEALGFQLDEEKGGSEEPVGLEDRLEDLETHLQEQQQAEEEAQQYEALLSDAEQQTRTLESKIGRRLSEQESELLGQTAWNSLMETGNLSMEEAWNKLEGYWTERQKAWKQTKKPTQVPGGGQPGQKTPDLSDDQARQQFLAQLIDSAE